MEVIEEIKHIQFYVMPKFSLRNTQALDLCIGFTKRVSLDLYSVSLSEVNLLFVRQHI